MKKNKLLSIVLLPLLLVGCNKNNSVNSNSINNSIDSQNNDKESLVSNNTTDSTTVFKTNYDKIDDYVIDYDIYIESGKTEYLDNLGEEIKKFVGDDIYKLIPDVFELDDGLFDAYTNSLVSTDFIQIRFSFKNDEVDNAETDLVEAIKDGGYTISKNDYGYEMVIENVYITIGKTNTDLLYVEFGKE